MDFETQTTELKQDNLSLEKAIEDLNNHRESLKLRVANQKIQEEKNHQEEIKFLRLTNQQLKSQVKEAVNRKQ